MTTTLGTLTLLTLVVAVVAIRKTFSLQRVLTQVQRDQYSTHHRLKQVPGEIQDAVHPLRLHLAKVASGGTVPNALIVAGRLYQEVSPAEANEGFSTWDPGTSGPVLFVDLQSPKEYAVRHIPGATLLPFEQLEERYRDVIPDSAEKVFVYCNNGERSRIACDFLSHRGSTNLYLIRGGLTGWTGPLEGEGPLTLVHIDRKAPLPVSHR